MNRWLARLIYFGVLCHKVVSHSLGGQLIVHWWQFWTANSWKSWWALRPAWSAYRSEAQRIKREIPSGEGRQEMVEVARPPRPISPAWVPASVLLLVAMAGGGGSQQASLNSLETTTTQVAEADATTTTSVPVSTSSTNVVGGSEVLPDVPQANVLFAPPTASGSGDPGSPFDLGVELVTVESITDGDTIDVQLGDGNVDTVRLIGINSSESGECFSDEASLILSILTPVGSQIGMTIDKTDRDIYGRLLRNVWVGTMSINEEMVRRGAAIAREYPPDTVLAGRLDDAQDEARDGRLGLWAPSACGPSAGTEISIVRIEADAAGDDNENLNEEYVRLRNLGDLAVDMTGWVLKDASASHRYAFPAGFLLAAGLEVRIYSGCGTDTPNSLYWCSGGAIWNNDGDTAFVLDQNGNTVVYQDYVPVATTTSSTTSTSTTTPATTAPPTTTTSNDCHPSYTGQCVPVGVEDVDCLGGSGNGPYYVGRVTIVGPDEYGLDGNDKDGIGCENS